MKNVMDGPVIHEGRPELTKGPDVAEIADHTAGI